MHHQNLLSIAVDYSITPRRTDDPRLAAVLEKLDKTGPGCTTVLAGAVCVLLVVGTVGLTVFRGWSWAPALIVLAISAALVAGAYVFDQRDRASTRARRAQLLREGRLSIAHVIQANSALYEPDTDYLPALVVLTDSTEHDVALGRYLVQQIRALKGGPNPGGDAEPLWRAVNDDHSEPKLVLPASLTQGRWAYFTAVTVDQRLLPGQRLDRDNPEFLVIGDPNGEEFLNF